jgi:benzoyl-CoA reductase/2-hydroxyglutaryl-CoA dehydratase subunit BcrC/BadD/HgdB
VAADAPVALRLLEEVYAARLRVARETAESGRTVVGVVGADVPVELVTAAGAVAYRLHGHPDVVGDQAREILGAGLDPVAHSLLTRILDGSAGFLAGIVVSRDCQASLQLFYALRELRRLDPHRAIPPVHLLDLLHLPTAHTVRYDEARLHQLADVLSGWTGEAIRSRGLTEAQDGVARLRRLLRELDALRTGPAPRLTGTQALRVLGAVTALPLERSLALVSEVVGDAATLPVGRAKPRVFVTGSAQDHDEVHRALEQDLDCQVVGEDHDWGALALAIEVRGSGIPALARAYRDRGPCAPTSSISRRAAWTAEQVRLRSADVLLGVVREHDEAPAWDFPAQRGAAGVPAALLERQPYRIETDDLRAALRAATLPPAVAVQA